MSEELNLEPVKQLLAYPWNQGLGVTEVARHLIAEVERLRAALGSRGAHEEPLPPSLQASIDLFRENPEAWHEEWSRKHEFKVKLLKENAALRGVGTPQEKELLSILRGLLAIPGVHEAASRSVFGSIVYKADEAVAALPSSPAESENPQ